MKRRIVAGTCVCALVLTSCGIPGLDRMMAQREQAERMADYAVEDIYDDGVMVMVLIIFINV